MLPQILPLFPEEINTFVDLFCGGCNIGINVNANKIICNDTEKVIIDMYKDLSRITSGEALVILKETINRYDLSKTNELGFQEIRSDYNKGSKSWNMFYAMLSHSFNYQIRFNKNGGYNMPFGKNRSSFNPTMENNFIKFVDRLNELNISFSNNSFSGIKIEKLNKSDLIYCDPPYLITCASYNENGGWNEKLERQLLDKLDEANDNGVKFALSNILRDGDKSNDILIEWSEKYIVHNLENNYGNSNYQKKNKSKSVTQEVLIINY